MMKHGQEKERDKRDATVGVHHPKGTQKKKQNR
jgi:hypothetical protein